MDANMILCSWIRIQKCEGFLFMGRMCRHSPLLPEDYQPVNQSVQIVLANVVEQSQ